MERTKTVHTTLTGIALLATIIGATLQFSAFFDTKTIEGIIEKVSGNAETIKLVLSILLGMSTGALVTATLRHKARAQEKLKAEEDKKAQVAQ